MARQSWSVEFHHDCESWAHRLRQDDQEALLAAIRILESEGPALGRPLVDTIVGSRFPNMKELRPGSTGRTEVRVLFAFDKKRQAILLVGGDKSEDWAGWYRQNIPIADDRFAAHLATLEDKASRSATRGRRTGRDKGNR